MCVQLRIPFFKFASFLEFIYTNSVVCRLWILDSASQAYLGSEANILPFPI